MDNKRNITALIIVVGLSMLWLQVVWPWLAKKNNWATVPTPVQKTDSTPAVPSRQSSTVASSQSSTTNPIAGLHASANGGGARELTLGSVEYDPDPKHPKSPFPLGLALNPRGASIAAVTLNRFKKQYDRPEPYVFQQPYEVSSPLAMALATRAITVDGAIVPLDSLDWNLASPATNAAATFAADIDNGTNHILRVTKTYELRPETDETAGYEVLIRYGIENLTAQPHTVRFAFNGPNAPRPENTRDVPEAVGGFDGGHVNLIVEHKAVSSIKSGEPLDIPELKSAAKLVWSGMVSAYFDAIVRPTDASGASLPLSRAKAAMLTPNEKDPLKQAVAIDYETGDLQLPANGSAGFALNTYLGPKLRAVVNNKYFSAFPLAYDQTLVLTSSCYSVCTWAWLINLLVLLLQGFHFLLRDWGLAIIGLVLLVRLLLHPITKSSQVSMSRMTKLGPEMERLKAKYGDDTEGLKKAQVEFYREQGVAPFLGCLPMFLQMPIWVALWSALQSTFEIRHAPFLQFGSKSLTWIHDLSQPDRLIVLKQPMDFFFLHIDGLNLLPLLMGVVFFINQKYQPQPVALKPEQEQQQKMMKWMSIIMFPLFLYSSPSGLNLYIFTSTLIGIFESKRIRAHIKEKEDREKAGVVIVDGPIGAKRVVSKPPGLGSALSGGIAGFFSKLQQLDEEAKRKQPRPGNKKDR